MPKYKHITVSAKMQDVGILIQVIDNHIRYGESLQRKARIFLIANTIIILSVAENFFFVNTSFWFTISACLLFCASVAAIVFALLSISVKVVSELKNEMDEQTWGNLLFCEDSENKMQMDCSSQMNEMIEDADYYVIRLTEDIYQLALILVEKRRLLKISYLVVLFGVILFSISFFLALSISNN